MTNRLKGNMMSEKQTLALYLADWQEATATNADMGRPAVKNDKRRLTAAELRGLHTANIELLEALKESLSALEWVVEQGGGPECEHESGGAICFCKENSAINSARKALEKHGGK